MMEISVITICYNAAEVLEATIQSVLQQTYPSLQYIIVDGQSTDTTSNILAQYQNSNIKIISEKDKGIYDAMNKGWRNATGEYIIFMNAGDVFTHQDVLLDLSREFSDTDIVYGDWKVKYNWGKVDRKAESLIHIKSHLPFSHQASLVRKSVLEKYAGFDLQYKICADYDLFLKSSKDLLSFQYIPICIAVVSSGGYSDTYRMAAWVECESIRVKNGMPATPFLTMQISKIKIRAVGFIKKIIGQKLISWITKRKYHS